MADWDRRRDERERYRRPEHEGRGWRGSEGRGFGEEEFGQGFRRGFRRHGGSYEAGAGGDFGGQRREGWGREGYGREGWDREEDWGRGRSYGREGFGGERGRGDWERDYGREGYRSDFGGRETGGRYGAGYGREPYGTDWAEEGYGQGFVGNEGRGFGYGRDYEGERRVTGGPGGRGEGRGERGWWERASDEVASWFGDEDAERRRQQDHRGRGPRGYTRSDERIKEDVSDRLADDPWVDASEIEVVVAGGEVTLSGMVDSRETRRRAEDIAERVSGVGHVQNNLRVRRPGATGTTGISSERSPAAAAGTAAATGTLPSGSSAGRAAGNGGTLGAHERTS